MREREEPSRSHLVGNYAHRIALIGYSTQRTLRDTLDRLAWEDPRLALKWDKRYFDKKKLAEVRFNNDLIARALIHR